MQHHQNGPHLVAMVCFGMSMCMYPYTRPRATKQGRVNYITAKRLKFSKYLETLFQKIIRIFKSKKIQIF